MRVLGIDSDSFRIVGVILNDGVFEDSFLIEAGEKLAEDRFTFIGERFRVRASVLKEKYKVDFVVIEESLYIQSPHATVTTTSVIAVIRYLLEQNKVKYKLLKNSSWKKLTFGTGKKTKEETAAYVKTFGSFENRSQHFYDAYCIALAGTKLLEEKDGKLD